MSIIYDALKKVQNNNLNTMNIVNKENQIKNDSSCKKFSVLIILFLVVLGIFLGQLLFGLFLPKEKKYNNKKIENLPAISISSSSSKNQMSETPNIKKEESFNTSTPLLSTLPSLVLNGIFFTDDEAYALINNQVFKENDAINGVRIIAIHPDSVDLVFEGRNFTLRVE